MTFPDVSSLFDLDTLRVRSVSSAPAPLVLQARRPVAATDLDPDVARAIGAELPIRSALLIRGLRVEDVHAAAALSARLFAGEPVFETGEHPKAQDSAVMYTPVRFAPEEKLLWHHENSFNAIWPRFIMFVSAVPAAEGGATPIVDGRLVHAHMPVRVRTALAEQGVLYERLCDGRTSRRWEDIYGTRDGDEACRRAEANGEQLIFTAQGARIQALRPAMLAVAHGTSWFNQLLHWHPAALPDEIRGLIADGLIAPYRSCRLGSGDEIAGEVVDQLIAVCRDLEFAVEWRAGDVLLLDNAVFAHGRNPYRGPREHFVRMAGCGRSPALARAATATAAPPASRS